MSVISPRGKRLTNHLTSLSIGLMVISAISGIAFGTTVFQRKIRLPEPNLQSERKEQSPEKSPAETVSPPQESCDTTRDDQAVQAASFSMPDADESIGMGWGCRSEAECRRAIKSLTNAIRLKPDSSNAYCKRAWIYFTLGQFHKAIKDAGKSIHFDPKNADAYQVRSYAYGSLGQDHRMSLDEAKYMKLATQPH
jgi:Tfp pilus assembly protein PilF